MTKHFYAADYANQEQLVSAFTQKSTRDAFVADGRYRFSLYIEDANCVCSHHYQCTAREAVLRGLI
jgi:hypothetical protein